MSRQRKPYAFIMIAVNIYIKFVHEAHLDILLFEIFAHRTMQTELSLSLSLQPRLLPSSSLVRHDELNIDGFVHMCILYPECCLLPKPVTTRWVRCVVYSVCQWLRVTPASSCILEYTPFPHAVRRLHAWNCFSTASIVLMPLFLLWLLLQYSPQVTISIVENSHVASGFPARWHGNAYTHIHTHKHTLC